MPRIDKGAATSGISCPLATRSVRRAGRSFFLVTTAHGTRASMTSPGRAAQLDADATAIERCPGSLLRPVLGLRLPPLSVDEARAAFSAGSVNLKSADAFDLGVHRRRSLVSAFPWCCGTT